MTNSLKILFLILFLKIWFVWILQTVNCQTTAVCYVSPDGATTDRCGGEIACATIRQCLQIRKKVDLLSINLTQSSNYTGEGFCNLTEKFSFVGGLSIQGTGSTISCPGQPFMAWYLRSTAYSFSVSSLTISDCANAARGGCISVDAIPTPQAAQYSVSFTDVAFVNGQSQSDGGCLAVLQSSITVQLGATKFIGCESGANGGAFYGIAVPPSSLAGATFINNSATLNGGAIYIAPQTAPQGYPPRSFNGANTFFQGNVAGQEGGALWFQALTGWEVSFEEAVFLQNTAFRGGALFMVDDGVTRWNGGLSCQLCTFLGNKAAEDGGAIFHAVVNGSDAMEFSQSNLTGNTAGRDGGFAVGIMAIEFSHFNQNTAGRDGGAVVGLVTSALQSYFQGNTAGRDGGAIMGSASLTQVFFSNNTAGRDGGAFIGVFDSEQVTFTANTAVRNGGGAACLNQTSPMTTVSLISNQAGGIGGGLYLVNSFVTSSGSIISSNTAAYGGGAGLINATLNVHLPISNNQATVSGGGLYVANLNLSSFFLPSLMSNTAVVSAGGVYFVDCWGSPPFQILASNLPNQVDCFNFTAPCTDSTIGSTCFTCGGICAEDPDYINTCYK